MNFPLRKKFTENKPLKRSDVPPTCKKWATMSGSLIFATEGNKVDKCLFICKEKNFPCPAFFKNRRKGRFINKPEGFLIL